MMTDQIWRNEEQAVFALRGLYQRYGYAPYKMSQFEEYDLYVRNKDFLISDQIITFSGEGGKLMALKPDVTLSIVKNAPEEPGVVQKVYYSENVYRDYREILQAGLECVGDLTDYDIVEAVLLAVKSLALLGEHFVLDISHMGLLAAVLEHCGFDGRRRKQAMACLRRKNAHDLKQLCGDRETAWEILQAVVSCRGGVEALEALRPLLTTEAEQQAMAELETLLGILRDNGYGDRVRLDFSVSNDLGYYSGVVFRGYLEGIPSSILSGGQYDKLPRKMGRKSRAIGFAIYVDLLQELYREDNACDVDTLILHDGSVPLTELNRAAEAAAKDGSVLVATTLPKGRSWKKLVRMEGGAVQ
ncbi:MAG: ATP phosphoribosyltransferase regulatory subunit [Candidatus Faecousia sp.]|nr:ATP phosphoribosyltransferase regulatory subunit [Candidatus Faecousia sp.]